MDERSARNVQYAILRPEPLDRHVKKAREKFAVQRTRLVIFDVKLLLLEIN